MKKKKKGTKKKIRIKFFNIFLFLTFILIIIGAVYEIANFKITNIYIKNNYYLTDLEVIETAKIKDYPSTFQNSCKKIEKRLEKNPLIKTAKVKKTCFTRVYIDIEENPLLFYDVNISKIVLKDGTTFSGNYDVPTLINQVPNKVYKKMITKFALINPDILDNISEIKYDPDNVDKERFLLTMSDGNYVYITLSKCSNINNYLKYIKEFNNKKGILYLNSGEYFKIMEN
ncbi:MAG: FtsQ-type POTRA domain-containing protein [Tenericutes bacterium]|nr:FtsQ-type POTRA domain-containing protein [Mycoplasmatota bacterium]